MIIAPRSTQAGFAARFAALTASFLVLQLGSLPIVLSQNLWVFKDRGNFLNLDYLLERGLRLGVDAYYSYGLLPVLLQHWLFVLFGRGYWPLLGANVAYSVAAAAAWVLLADSSARPWFWTLAVIALSPIVLWVNPNFPYCLVILSMLFGLALVLRGRPDLALAAASVGCFSVPSLSLVFAALLSVAVTMRWWSNQPRSFVALARAFAPGVLAYGGLALLLAAVFGVPSLLATATPFNGMRLYRAAHYGLFSSGLPFLHPDGAGLRCYIEGRATWFVASSLLLFALGLHAVLRMLITRRASPAAIAVMLCAAVQAVFVFAAYGVPDQHVIFDPIMVAGVLISLFALPPRGARSAMLAGFVLLGMLGTVGQARETRWAWENERPEAGRFTSLYDRPDWRAAWSHILDLATENRLLLLSYSTGAHHYFPPIQSAAVWVLQVGQLFPADHERVMAQLQDATIVVQDLRSLTDYADQDAPIQAALGAFCLAEATPQFLVWRRDPPPGTACLDRLHLAAAGQPESHSAP